LGFSKGNNIGICDANGKYILLLNSDTELLNNAISIAIEKMESDNSIGVISGLLRSPNGQIQATASRFPSIKRELRELFRLNKSFNKEKRSLYNLGEEWNPYEQVEADWVWGTFFLFKKKILDNFQGKLPDKLFMYAEDIDWCWKIKKLGLKIIYYPKAMILHHGGASLPSEMEHSKFYNRMFPNIFLVVAWNTSFIYAYTLYFIRGLHYFTLRNRLDFLHGVKIFKFLFGRKNYWLNR
jgi:GT2 family glycosyltransferase